MSAALKSLNFTTLQKPSTNPTLDRRARVIARLEEQKLLLADPNYKRTVRSWSKNDAGDKSLVDTKQRVLPWWSAQSNGTYAFFIRSGWKAIEFEKGKAAIAVPTLERLSTTIDTLITAVRNGELDEQLAQASAQARPRKANAKRPDSSRGAANRCSPILSLRNSPQTLSAEFICAPANPQ